MDNPIPMPAPRDLLIERVRSAIETQSIQREYVLSAYQGREVRRELNFHRDWFVKDLMRALSGYLGDDMPSLAE